MKFFLYMLAILFIGLKLGGVVAWPWWLVLLPLWGGIAFYLVLLVIVLVVAAIVDGVLEMKRRKG